MSSCRKFPLKLKYVLGYYLSIGCRANDYKQHFHVRENINFLLYKWFINLVSECKVVQICVSFLHHFQKLKETRMHSSRMPTALSLSDRGVSVTENPPWTENPLDRDTPWTETPSGQRPSQTETCLDRDPLDRDPPGHRSPGQKPPGQRLRWTETPWTETPLDRDWDPPVNRQTPVKT